MNSTNDSESSALPLASSTEKVVGSVAEESIEYPTGMKLGLISLAMCLSMFLVALVRATSFFCPRFNIDPALRITLSSRWRFLKLQISSIASTILGDGRKTNNAARYLLTTASFQLLFGRLYSFLSLKWVYIAAIGVFELGSLICAVAPSSTALIIGRAIAGLGGSGLATGTLIICVSAVPLERRSIYMGLISAVYWAGSVAGPLLGGALTDKASWRFCFWINLPIGAMTVIVIALFFKPPGNIQEVQSISLRKRIEQFDPWGTLVFIPATVCLLLALQWGGSQYSWSNGRIIALLILFGVLIAAFVAIQAWKQDDATVPPRVFNQPGIKAAAWFALCLSGSFLTLVYLVSPSFLLHSPPATLMPTVRPPPQLPIYFQAIKGASPVQSGIDNLPLVLSVVLATLAAGALITKIGYYTPFMILASVLVAVGAGVLSTLSVDAGAGHWIGYQIIYGIGVGAGIQQPLMVAQAVLKPADVPIGTSLILFMQTLGGSVFVSVGQNVFRSRLLSGLIRRAPGIDPSIVLNSGATRLHSAVDPALLPEVLAVYNDAIVAAIYVCLAVAALSIVGSLATEWRNVRAPRAGGSADAG
ncbi:Major facilitator superfamily transporter [Mycena venus]|uniref:Major facilitator superfamily transporter n=1 Tax=Mycena venus TaxID=2733690 RepID=A0A8H7CFD3_9AGAR|nr:Major facilitator superfamily transporter [Mycena venus]